MGNIGWSVPPSFSSPPPIILRLWRWRLLVNIIAGVCFETDAVAPDHHCWQIFCDGSVGLYNDEDLFQNEALRTLERLKKHKISLSKLYPSVLPCTRMLNTSHIDSSPLVYCGMKLLFV